MSRAHFYADVVRDVYIQLPEEDPRSNEAGICGKLEKTMYATLDAAERRSEHYASPSLAQGSPEEPLVLVTFITQKKTYGS